MHPPTVGGATILEGLGFPEQIRQTAPIVITKRALIALNIGDAVFMDPLGSGKVTKSNIAGDRPKIIGVVVGGARVLPSPAPIVLDQGMVNKLAANANETVVVAIAGIAFCIADAAIAISSLVTLSTINAGRVVIAAAPAAGEVIGKNLEAAAAQGNVIAVLLRS